MKNKFMKKDETNEDFQTLPNVKYKGTISKIDTKARSGYIDVQSKRLPFIYAKNLPQEKFEILVYSLRTRVQLYLIGEVTMDYEANPKSMSVTDIESDSTLFSGFNEAEERGEI